MEPDHFGRYEIKRELGRGGMATVYQANDPRFKREVALKVLPAQFLHDPTFRARFEREAQIIAGVEHPAIVPVYDYGDENGQPYFVMRYMTGGSLSDRIEKGPISLTETARIVNRLAPALDEMHAKGIIHRDLKPGNILFDQYNNAYLSDFGIARLTQSGAGTLTGSAIIGTPAYMSPEQARGETNLDGRSDIYAFGAIVFEMLTGRLPYQADTPIAIAMKHLTEPVPRILEVRQDLPPDCQELINRAMAKERERRYSTASAMDTTFQGILSRQANPVHPAPPARVAGQPTIYEPAQPARPAPSQAPQPYPPAARAQPYPSPVPAQPAPAVYPPRPAAQVPPVPYKPAPVYAPARQAASNRSPWVMIVGGSLIFVVVCGLLVLLVFGGGKLLAGQNRTATPLSPTQEIQASQVMASPTPVSIFADYFTDPASGWDHGSQGSNITDYENGSFHILVGTPGSIFWSTPHVRFGDVSIQVSATKAGGPDENAFGVICRYQDENNFYLMTVGSNGTYSVAKYRSHTYSLIGMAVPQFNDAIKQGTTTNLIQVDCVGNSLSLSANNTRLISVTDSDFSEGDIGLVAAAPYQGNVSILFNDFKAEVVK